MVASLAIYDFGPHIRGSSFPVLIGTREESQRDRKDAESAPGMRMIRRHEGEAARPLSRPARMEMGKDT